MLTLTLTMQDGTEQVLEFGDAVRVTVQGVTYADEKIGQQQPVELGYSGSEIKSVRVDGYLPPLPPLPPPPMRQIPFRLNESFEPTMLSVPDHDDPAWNAQRQRYLREQVKRAKTTA